MQMNANEVMGSWTDKPCVRKVLPRFQRVKIRPAIHANKLRSSLAACLQHEALDSDLGMDARQSLHDTPKRRG